MKAGDVKQPPFGEALAPGARADATAVAAACAEWKTAFFTIIKDNDIALPKDWSRCEPTGRPPQPPVRCEKKLKLIVDQHAAGDGELQARWLKAAIAYMAETRVVSMKAEARKRHRRKLNAAARDAAKAAREAEARVTLTAAQYQ
jgi:hypothetical protein